jgi:hypothetical protein
VLKGSPFPQAKPMVKASSRLAVGDRVTHDRLGLGRVVRLVDDQDVIVDFGHPDGLCRSVAHATLTVL